MDNNVEKVDLDRVDWKSSREFFESLGETLDKLDDKDESESAKALLRLAHQSIKPSALTSKRPRILTIQKIFSSLATILTH